MSWSELPEVLQNEIFSMRDDIYNQELLLHKEKLRMSLFYIKYPETKVENDNLENFYSSIKYYYELLVTFVLYLKMLYLYIRY